MRLRVVAIVLGALLLASCRLDVDVSVVMEPDGTGTVTVVAVADAALVGQVDDLADELVFDDVAAGGWTVDGPTPTEDGGLTITFTHPFASDQELANVLGSIGPPFTDMVAGRLTEEDQTTNEIQGTLVLADGYASFADADLTEAVGGLPFADRFEATGADPAEAMSFTLRIALPGEVIVSTGTEVAPEQFEWTAPLDGSAVDVSVSTVQRPASGGAWAGPLATAALVALVVWVALSMTFIAFVLIARRNRARRRRTHRLDRLERLDRPGRDRPPAELHD